jgi:alcohol dehydrogenase class IV
VTVETVFTYGAPDLKFGAGAADEIGFDLTRYGVRRVLVITDAGVAATGSPQRIADAMKAYGVEAEIFAESHVEPTDASLRHAVELARSSGPWDAFVAVGGGSSIDTAKAVNLLDLKVKTGISHGRLRPTLAVVDPLLTVTQPAAVTAACGMDILCHALESYTARPYTEFERKSPEQRVPYCGANPVADMWSEKALQLLARSFRAAVADGDDLSARTDMAMAATFAGMGFGNAGVHIPHANAYPIAGGVRDFHPDGYPAGEPLVPHGMAVSLTAPEAFRFTFEASPERHLRIAELLAAPVAPDTEPGERLPAALIAIMSDIGIPNGLGAVGYTEADVDTLAAGAMKQQRLLATAPRPVSDEDIAGILRRSLILWG